MEETKKLLQRCDVPEVERWAIEDLYATDELWEQDLEKVRNLQEEAASFAGKLAENPAELLAYLTKKEELAVLSENLGNYAYRKSDEDTRIGTYQAMTARFHSAMVALEEATSFETPEIMSISDEKLEQFYAQEAGLGRYRRYLSDLRRLRDHTLSPVEEKMLAGAGEMAGAPGKIFSMFTNADLKYPDAIDAEGKAHPLSAATYGEYMESTDRVLRKSAFENVYHTLGQFKNTSAAVMDAQVKQLEFFAKARRFPSALDASLAETNVPTSVYLNLIEAVHQNLDKMHRYVRLRKKLLGVDELHFYDIYTNLVPGADRRIPIEEAKQTVYEAVAPLGETYHSILKQGFENRWIDVRPNEGKRSGAYSAGARVHPFVLLNYSGTLDLSTT